MRNCLGSFSSNENLVIGDVITPAKVVMKSKVLENKALSQSPFYKKDFSFDINA